MPYLLQVCRFAFFSCVLFPFHLPWWKRRAERRKYFSLLKRKLKERLFFPKRCTFSYWKMFIMNSTSQFLPPSHSWLLMWHWLWLHCLQPHHTIPHHTIPHQLANPQPHVLTWVKFSLEDKLPGLPLCLLASVLPDETSLCLSPIRGDP